MDNNRLTIAVRNKVAQVNYGDYLVSDNKQLRIRFDLDSEWQESARKTARFVMDGWDFDVSFTGDTVTLPLLPAYAGELKVGLYAGDLRTTTAAVVPIRRSILSESEPVSMLDAAEMARVQAEAARVDAENLREQNELARQQAEAARQTNETARITNETARSNAEDLRRQAENRRFSAEQDRVTAESGRAAAEASRARAEAARAQAETGRASSESARREAESARVSAEYDRVWAENLRAAAESMRMSFENARKEAELLREEAESERAEAESERTEAESTRKSQENARQAAELLRVQAENTRIQNEQARIAAESAREARVDSVIDSFDDYMQLNDVFNVLALIREYGMRASLRMFCAANAPLVGLDEAVLRFFSAAGTCTNETYVSSFYRYSTSPSPVGSKKGVNATLVCEPSTMAAAGRDDYADLPLFACFDCNYTIDADTKEPVIHAIKDIYGEFSSAPVDSFVGVLQMTGWVRRTQDGTTKTVEYAAYRKEAGFKPLPEAVRARDNSVRPFVIHAKYAAGWNSQGKLSSVSGVMPMTGRPASVGGGNTSPSGQQTQWRRWGNQYTGSGICDQAFLQTMLEIKYANLGSPGIMAGCCTSTSNKTAAVSETGVRRILLTPEQASEYVVGVSVSLGSSQDRASTACYDVCGITRVAAVTSVTVNGVEYGAVELDVSSPFDTVAGATYIIVHPWYTGATDEVKGNDGSPYDNLSGREPFKLQGIEVMNGANEAAADTSAYLSSNNTTQIRARRLAEGSYTVIGTVPNGGAATGWQYISELNWAENDPETYLCYTSSGATETTGYCSKWYQLGRVASGEKLYGMYPSRGYGAGSGLCTVKLVNEMTLSDYTYSCRACGTAGNRGKYTENTETLG